MKRVIRLFFAAFIFIGFLQACKKNSTPQNYATAFVGLYSMTSNCSTGSNPVYIGSNGTNSIILPLLLGGGTSCEKYTAIPATVKQNIIETTTVTVSDSCNNVYSETVSGYLNGNNLSLTYITSNSAGSVTCFFPAPNKIIINISKTYKFWKCL